jgi:hypothetical protein
VHRGEGDRNRSTRFNHPKGQKGQGLVRAPVRALLICLAELPTPGPDGPALSTEHSPSAKTHRNSVTELRVSKTELRSPITEFRNSLTVILKAVTEFRNSPTELRSPATELRSPVIAMRIWLIEFTPV